MVTHRDRVLAALRHEEPDRVPIDFGATLDTTISALGYQALRAHLGLRPTPTRVLDIYQYTAVLDEDLPRLLSVDCGPVFDEPREWRKGTLTNGSPAEFPARFGPKVREDGSQVILDEAGNIVSQMPAGGYYFDPVYSPLAAATSVQDIPKCLTQIESYDRPAHLDKSYAELARQAEDLRRNSDLLLVGFFGGHIFQAAQSLRGWDTFLMDLLVNQDFAEALLDHLAEANIRRFRRYAETVGCHVDVIHFEDDLGMQDRPLLRPSLYRQMVKPYHARLFEFAKSQCNAYLLLHSDGAIAPLIPDFIEMGIDAINPVQVSASGMGTHALKREFGQDITFWGGGCESQTILPSGTTTQIVDEVKRRIDDLAPGGGFVFAPIHNIQADVPPENTIAMFEAALVHGHY
jgi:uroporphyrinogen decarboxylase